MADRREEELASMTDQAVARRRLKQILVENRTSDPVDEEELQALTLSNPEIFGELLVSPRRNGIVYAQSNLNLLLYFDVSLKTIQMVYQAYPADMHSIDWWGSSILKVALEQRRWHTSFREPVLVSFDLIKWLVDDFPELLSITEPCGMGPIYFAIACGSCSEDTIRYMIQKHPGNPFEEGNGYGRTLLLAACKASSHRSFEFVKYIFDAFPGAAQGQSTDKYETSALHAACSYPYRNPRLMTLLLRAYPAAAFFMARYDFSPLLELSLRLSGEEEMNEILRPPFELLVRANPDVIFCLSEPDKYCQSYSAFGIFYRNLGLGATLYFLLSVYRHRENVASEEAWRSPPRFPLHLAAACPCPVDFFLKMLNDTVGSIYGDDALLELDDDGCTVLSLALTSGYTWKGGVIRELVHREPRALGVRDRRTQMPPFLLAACHHEEPILNYLNKEYVYSFKREEELLKRRNMAEKDCFNDLYNILRADPTQLSHFAK